MTKVVPIDVVKNFVELYGVVVECSFFSVSSWSLLLHFDKELLARLNILNRSLRYYSKRSHLVDED